MDRNNRVYMVAVSSGSARLKMGGGPAPTNAQLGLVKTARGNEFSLNENTLGAGVYGAEGSAKLFLESKK